jgi:RimJ/RimL family protein N-acetyltransferase
MFYSHKNGIEYRKLRQSDLPALRDLKDESWFGTVNTACLNETDQENWFKSITGKTSCLYLIADKYTGFNDAEGNREYQPIGLYGITDINPVNRSCSFTHSVYKDWRGKGYGKRTLQAGIDLTFEVFNLRRIDTWILENNIAELKVSQSVGFKIEGNARKAVYKCGQYLDCHYLGLLREDWEADPRILSYKGVCNDSYRPKDGLNATSG